jgi:hypothetical protein
MATVVAILDFLNKSFKPPKRLRCVINIWNPEIMTRGSAGVRHYRILRFFYDFGGKNKQLADLFGLKLF